MIVIFTEYSYAFKSRWPLRLQPPANWGCFLQLILHNCPEMSLGVKLLPLVTDWQEIHVFFLPNRKSIPKRLLGHSRKMNQDDVYTVVKYVIAKEKKPGESLSNIYIFWCEFDESNLSVLAKLVQLTKWHP